MNLDKQINFMLCLYIYISKVYFLEMLEKGVSFCLKVLLVTGNHLSLMYWNFIEILEPSLNHWTPLIL